MASFRNTLNSTQKVNMDVIIDTLKKGGYTNPYTIAGICSIISKESVFNLIRENMNYSTDRIGQVWGRLRGRSDLGHNPEKLANAVYGGKYGNAAQDGYRYRGGGFNQLTFKGNYDFYGSKSGTQLGSNPDLIGDISTAAKVILYYYKSNYSILKNSGALKEYGASGDGNTFTDLKGAILGAYHATAGVGKKVSYVKGLLTSDSLGGMTKAQKNGPDILAYVKSFSGLTQPPPSLVPSDGGSTSTTAAESPATSVITPPEPKRVINNVKLIKKSGPGEIMGVVEVPAYLGEASFSGIQFDEPGDYVIHAVGDDDSIEPLEFKITVSGDPSPKSQEKAAAYEKLVADGNRPIIAQIDQPSVSLPPMKYDVAPADAQTNTDIITSIGLNPFLWLGGYQIREADIKSLSLYHQGITPCAQVVFNDAQGIMKREGFPLNNATFEIFLNSSSPYLKSIHMKFRLVNFQENSDKSMTITGMIELKDFYKINYNSYSGTSFEVLRSISKELQLGFNSNINSTSDSMKWTNVGKTFNEFMSSIMQFSYIDDKSFVMGYIDFYYCFNYVDLEKEWLRNIGNDVGISSGGIGRLATTKSDEQIARLYLSNEKSTNGSDLYFQNYTVKNDSTEKSITKGQRTVVKYYDTYSKSFLIFDIDGLTTPGDDNIILKGNPADSKDMEENYRTVDGGRFDLSNVHKEYLYAKTLNDRNLSDLSKISVTLEIPALNFNFYKFQKVGIQFVNEAQTISDPSLIQERISGEWMITEIKYIWIKNKINQTLTCVRKELGKIIEEKRQDSGNKEPEKKSGGTVAHDGYFGNEAVPAVPPNSIFKIGETYTVQDKDGRLFTVTIENLESNGNDIQGYILENSEQPELKPIINTGTSGTSGINGTSSTSGVNGTSGVNATPVTSASQTSGPINFVIGDSIAAGLAKLAISSTNRSGAYNDRNGKRVPPSKDEWGISQVGANPGAILGFINEIGSSKLSGKKVLLSSGYTNGPAQKQKVKDQLALLKEWGCKVLLVGATNNPPQNLSGSAPNGLSDANTQLKALAEQYGFTFLGEFTPNSSDHIHPNSYPVYYNTSILPYTK
jgi:predicted chitinase